MAGDMFQANDSASFATPVLHTERRPQLIVLEGIDLSGRTTQVQLLRDWLVAQRYSVTTTAWRTSPLISDVLARARISPPLRPLTYSMLYCADHIDRTQRVIRPALESGEIVLADRYIYTAFARDAARGLDSSWVRNLYRFSVPPDKIFYLHITPEEAVKRRMALQNQREGQPDSSQLKKSGKSGKDSKDGKDGKHHKQQEKGRSLALAQTSSLSQEALESFRNFEKKMYSEYQQMQKEFDFSVIEGDQSISEVQTMLCRAITHLLLDR